MFLPTPPGVSHVVCALMKRQSRKKEKEDGSDWRVDKLSGEQRNSVREREIEKPVIKKPTHGQNKRERKKTGWAPSLRPHKDEERH